MKPIRKPCENIWRPYGNHMKNMSKPCENHMKSQMKSRMKTIRKPYETIWKPHETCQCLFPVRLPVYDTWFRFHSAFLLACLLVRSQTPAARSQTTHKIWTRAKQNNALHVLYFTGLCWGCFWVSLGSFRVMLDILDPTWPNLAQLESQDRSRWPQVAPTWANLAPNSPKIGPTWANLGQLGPQILDFWRILRVMLAPKIDKKSIFLKKVKNVKICFSPRRKH